MYFFFIQVGVCLLWDNEFLDLYCYEVILWMGMCCNVGIKFKVSIILYGDEQDSEVCVLYDFERNFF